MFEDISDIVYVQRLCICSCKNASILLEYTFYSNVFLFVFVNCLMCKASFTCKQIVLKQTETNKVSDRLLGAPIIKHKLKLHLLYKQQSKDSNQQYWCNL